MKFIVLLSVLLLSELVPVFAAETISLIHYNIKELDSKKLLLADSSPQFSAVQKVLNEIKKEIASPAILSINEIQYDLPNVPNQKFQTKGQNLFQFLTAIGEVKDRYQSSFHPANTGNNAKPTSYANGIAEYYPDFSDYPNFLQHADPISFGIFPSQYSTAAAILKKYPIKYQIVINNVKWMDFNPKLKPEKYRDNCGRALRIKKDTKAADGECNLAELAKDMPLFDKNFTDTVVEINGRELHIILLHTVPSYDFGKRRFGDSKLETMNYDRNHDQLAFVEWYLSGNTSHSFNIHTIKGKYITEDFSLADMPVASLNNQASFVAVGDWNVDIYNPKKEDRGHLVLERLYKKFQAWLHNPDNKTYEGGGFNPKPGFQAQLDYILLSNDLKIKKSGIYRPDANYKELGCSPEKPVFTSSKNRSIQSYQNSNNETCWVEVDQAFVDLKTASDHFPLWLEFSF